MKAVLFDGTVRFVSNFPIPEPSAGEALVRVLTAGVCQTDIEIVRGYMGYTGVLGHEFVGVVDVCENTDLIGVRVAGEINVPCRNCRWCQAGMEQHCEDRSVLGILGRHGCMAEYCALPVQNLHPVPENISNDRAVLIEPLAAACRIAAQIPFDGTEKIIVLGDGRLGILCAWVLSTVVDDITLVGRNPWKLERAVWQNRLRTMNVADSSIDDADVVIETTGSESGLPTAIAMCRPRGTIVLKSTVAADLHLDFTPVVVNELGIVGSRCGSFVDGIRILSDYPEMPLERLITARFPVHKAEEAFAKVRKKGQIKVLIDMDDTASEQSMKHSTNA